MDDLVQCPYNVSHLIQKPRLGRHLIKCRRQHQLLNFTTCPFNSNHDVPSLELQYHIETCEDRDRAESSQYVVGEPSTKAKPQENIKLPPSDENWDEDPPIPSYLDIKDKVLENRLVYRNPVGLTKSEKRNFYWEETKRFQKIVSDQQAPGKSTENEVPKPPSKPKPGHENVSEITKKK